MVSIGVYCHNCFAQIRREPGGGPCGGLIWIEKCDRCVARELEGRAELERLEEMWRARECAAPDCRVVFTPATTTQLYCQDRCRKRAHRRAKARRAAAA